MYAAWSTLSAARDGAADPSSTASVERALDALLHAARGGWAGRKLAARLLPAFVHLGNSERQRAACGLQVKLSARGASEPLDAVARDARANILPMARAASSAGVGSLATGLLQEHLRDLLRDVCSERSRPVLQVCIDWICEPLALALHTRSEAMSFLKDDAVEVDGGEHEEGEEGPAAVVAEHESSWLASTIERTAREVRLDPDAQSTLSQVHSCLPCNKASLEFLPTYAPTQTAPHPNGYAPHAAPGSSPPPPAQPPAPSHPHVAQQRQQYGDLPAPQPADRGEHAHSERVERDRDREPSRDREKSKDRERGTDKGAPPPAHGPHTTPPAPPAASPSSRRGANASPSPATRTNGQHQPSTSEIRGGYIPQPPSVSANAAPPPPPPLPQHPTHSGSHQRSRTPERNQKAAHSSQALLYGRRVYIGSRWLLISPTTSTRIEDEVYATQPRRMRMHSKRSSEAEYDSAHDAVGAFESLRIAERAGRLEDARIQFHHNDKGDECIVAIELLDKTDHKRAILDALEQGAIGRPRAAWMLPNGRMLALEYSPGRVPKDLVQIASGANGGAMGESRKRHADMAPPPHNAKKHQGASTPAAGPPHPPRHHESAHSRQRARSRSR